jgi:molecular chaperone HscA
LLAASSSDDAAFIEERIKTLASATEAFAAQRMNRGIASALTGRNVETI